MRSAATADNDNAMVYRALSAAGLMQISIGDTSNAIGHPDMIDYMFETLHKKLASAQCCTIYGHPGIVNENGDIVAFGIGTEYFFKLSEGIASDLVPKEYSTDKAQLLSLGKQWVSGKYGPDEYAYIQGAINKKPNQPVKGS